MQKCSYQVTGKIRKDFQKVLVGGLNAPSNFHDPVSVKMNFVVIEYYVFKYFHSVQKETLVLLNVCLFEAVHWFWEFVVGSSLVPFS